MAVYVGSIIETRYQFGAVMRFPAISDFERSNMYNVFKAMLLTGVVVLPIFLTSLLVKPDAGFLIQCIFKRALPAVGGSLYLFGFSKYIANTFFGVSFEKVEKNKDD